MAAEPIFEVPPRSGGSRRDVESQVRGQTRRWKKHWLSVSEPFRANTRLIELWTCLQWRAARHPSADPGAGIVRSLAGCLVGLLVQRLSADIPHAYRWRPVLSWGRLPGTWLADCFGADWRFWRRAAWSGVMPLGDGDSGATRSAGRASCQAGHIRDVLHDGRPPKAEVSILDQTTLFLRNQQVLWRCSKSAPKTGKTGQYGRCRNRHDAHRRGWRLCGKCSRALGLGVTGDGDGGEEGSSEASAAPASSSRSKAESSAGDGTWAGARPRV